MQDNSDDSITYLSPIEECLILLSLGTVMLIARVGVGYLEVFFSLRISFIRYSLTALGVVWLMMMFFLALNDVLHLSQLRWLRYCINWTLQPLITKILLLLGAFFSWIRAFLLVEGMLQEIKTEDQVVLCLVFVIITLVMFLLNQIQAEEK